MTRWEYRLVESFATPDLASAQLTSLGYEGWEAIGMYGPPHDPTTQPVHERGIFVLMKRPRASDTGAGTVDLG